MLLPFVRGTLNPATLESWNLHCGLVHFVNLQNRLIHSADSTTVKLLDSVSPSQRGTAAGAQRPAGGRSHAMSLEAHQSGKCLPSDRHEKCSIATLFVNVQNSDSGSPQQPLIKWFSMIEPSLPRKARFQVGDRVRA